MVRSCERGTGAPFGYHPKLGRYADLLNYLLDFAVDMKARSMFLLSLILMAGALILVLRGRGQLEEGFRSWRSGDRELFRQFAHRGAWLLYPAWVLAAGGVACLFASYRRRERAWRWTAVVLLVLLVLVVALIVLVFAAWLWFGSTAAA